MFDETVFTQDTDGAGVYSKSLAYSKFECYKHLSGDKLYVAEDRTNGRRHFFDTAAQMRVWVEGQPKTAVIWRQSGDLYYRWRPATWR